MKVADLMRTAVRAVTGDTPVSEVVVSLADAQVSGRPLVDTRGQVGGVVSSTDLIAAQAKTRSAEQRQILEQTPVREIMTPRPLMISSTAEVQEAARHMLYAEVRRLWAELSVHGTFHEEITMTTTLREPSSVPSRTHAPGATSRSGIVASLNRRLANAVDLQLQAKQAHWNVKGPSFIALHDLFERVAGEVAQYADLLAERAVQLGGVAEGGMQVVAQRSELPRYPAQIASGTDHVMALANSIAACGVKMQPGIAEAEQAGDPVTADILTDISRASTSCCGWSKPTLTPAR